jgi:hypothetical protein
MLFQKRNESVLAKFVLSSFFDGANNSSQSTKIENFDKKRFTTKYNKWQQLKAHLHDKREQAETFFNLKFGRKFAT